MEEPTPPGKTDWGRVAALSGVFAVVLIFWWTPLVFPLKLLVVVFHELSHGLMAIATGGKIEKIEISIWQGGVCWVQGGNDFLVTSAGYLGSLVCGGAILVGASRTRYGKALSVGLGLLLIAVSVLYVPWFSFGWFFCLIFGALLAIAGRHLPGRINELILMTIGLVSCLYAPLDILDDTVLRQLQDSDASRLGELTGVPGPVWGLVWIVIAALGTAFFVFVASRKITDTPPLTQRTIPKKPFRSGQKTGSGV